MNAPYNKSQEKSVSYKHIICESKLYNNILYFPYLDQIKAPLVLDIVKLPHLNVTFLKK